MKNIWNKISNADDSKAIMIYPVVFIVILVLALRFALWPAMVDILTFSATQSYLSAECASLGYPDYMITNTNNMNSDTRKYYCVGIVNGSSVVVPLVEARGGR
jgi:hypothetical protein